MSNRRLSWQRHHKSAEIWNVVKCQASKVRSDTYSEDELEIFNLGETDTLKKGESHFLVGLNVYAVIAQIWRSTDVISLSDEDDIYRVQNDFGR